MKTGFWLTLSRLWRMGVSMGSHLLRPRNMLPCVGLIVLGGCLTFIIAPDPPMPGGSAAFSPWNNAPPTIVIDPGHGGRDEGAKVNGLVEKVLTLDVALRLERILNEAGFVTVMTRRDDSRVSLADRAAIANAVENSLFVSIHFNQSPYRSANGVETFFAQEKVLPESLWRWVGFFNSPEPVAPDEGEALAGVIQASLVTQLESGNRGSKGHRYYVVRHVQAPAVLIEAGFLSGKVDAKRLADPEYRERLASAIAGGVKEYQKRKIPDGAPTQLATAAR
jgi:N-acetylmuramoyl-L-alanine amidase